MPDHSRINLNDILREERKAKLVPLSGDFYVKVAEQISELEEEKRKIEDTYGTKYAIIEDELKTARKALENIIERRTAKIIKEASLRASSRQREKQDLDALTREECMFYNKLVELITEWRSALLDQIPGKVKEKQLIPCSQEAAPPENKEKEISFDGKKDISKEYIVVRLLKDIPTFAGADGRNYTLAKEDVVVLSTVNAKALINRNAAIRIPVKR